MRFLVYSLVLFGLIFQNKFFLGFKFIDLIFVSYFLYYFLTKKIYYDDLKFIILIFFLSVIIFSVTININTAGYFASIIFLYKIFFILLSIIFFLNLTNRDEIFFSKIFITFFLIILVWVFAINQKSILQFLIGVSEHRTGFPIIKNGNLGINFSSHLIAYVITLSSIFYFFISKKTYLKYLITIIAFYAAYLTGSRNSTIMFIIFFLYVFFSQKISIKLLLIIFITIIYLSISDYSLNNDIKLRSFSLLNYENLYTDASFLSRIRKAELILNVYHQKIIENFIYLFIPITHANVDIFWSDNILMCLLIVIGPFFTIILFLYFLILLINVIKSGNYPLFIYTLCALAGNLTTEFIFTSLGAIITTGQYFLIKKFYERNLKKNIYN